MNKTVIRALALCLTTAFATGYAVAKDDENNSSTSKSSSATSSGTSASSGKYSSSSSASAQAGKSCRVSKLMHTSVKDSQGQSLGTVQDAVIDPSSGQIQFVVLSLDSSSTGAPGSSSSATPGSASSSTTTSGIGTPSTLPPRGSTGGIGSTSGIGSSSSGNLVAVPWSLMQQPSGSSSSSEQQQITLNVDRAKLQSAPSFSSANWPTMDTTWSQQVYSHFGVDANSSTGAPGSSSSSGSGLGNPSTPGVPSTPGTPDITPPSSGTGTGTGTPSSPGSTGTSGSSGK